MLNESGHEVRLQIYRRNILRDKQASIYRSSEPLSFTDSCEQLINFTYGLLSLIHLATDNLVNGMYKLKSITLQYIYQVLFFEILFHLVHLVKVRHLQTH